MRNAHSPGPWNGSAAEIRDANGNVIAETFAVDDNPDKRYGYGTADANSRLISAAPDLLAALREIHRLILAYRAPNGLIQSAGTLEIVAAAIAKVDGAA